MDTTKYLESELESILHIHFDAKYYFKDVQYLCNPETLEERSVSIQNIFIDRLKSAYWRLGIIEIAKLFLEKNNQHYNLIGFLKKLISNYDDLSWIKELPKNKIQHWLACLNNEEILIIREKISVQRDKYFAHTDRNPSKSIIDNQLTLPEINNLLEITEEIIFNLKLHCLNVHSDMEIDELEKAGSVLEAFIALNEKRYTDIIKKWEDKIK